jgi:hypothetical protein
MTPRTIAAVVLTAIGALALAGCAPEPATAPTQSAPGATDAPAASPDPSPSPTATAVALPTDCRAILSPEVLTQLGTTALNDPATGQRSGVQADGSLLCVWQQPGAQATSLVTEIRRENRGPALDLLNELAATDGFSCFTPYGGTRCEKVWQDANNPVMNGRTLFWRDDVLIDTRWSNLAPKGYTDSIVAHLFPS